MVSDQCTAEEVGSEGEPAGFSAKVRSLDCGVDRHAEKRNLCELREPSRSPVVAHSEDIEFSAEPDESGKCACISFDVVDIVPEAWVCRVLES